MMKNIILEKYTCVIQKLVKNVIRRELEILPRDVFLIDDIMESARRLYMLGFFGDINPKVSEVKNKMK